MKIAVLSDFHLGFSSTEETENDSYENAEEAFDKALDADIILVAGDVFNSRSPTTNEWAKALHLFSKPLLKESTNVKIVSCTKNLRKVSSKTLNHVPVIAIHGNHERRSKGDVNAVEALENAGLLIHLHLQTILFEKDEKKVAIHAMSSVPERFAKDVMEAWKPKPINGCFNILLIHQNIDPYVYSKIEPPTLSLSNLPEGFDLIIDGHIHTHTIDKVGNTPFVVVGSTIVTQAQKSEAENRKGFVKLEIGKTCKIEFVPLENCRKFFYEEIDVGEHPRAQIEKKLEEILSSNNFSKPPLIRLKLTGKEKNVIDRELTEIEKKFYGKAILVFAKELESEEISQKAELLKNLREQKLSIEELGLNLLKETLEELNFSPEFEYERIFWLLSEGKVNEALKLIKGEQTTLDRVKA